MVQLNRTMHVYIIMVNMTGMDTGSFLFLKDLLIGFAFGKSQYS